MINLNFPSVWDYVDGAITTWQSFGNVTEILQAIVIGGEVLLALYMLFRFFRRISAHDQIDL